MDLQIQLKNYLLKEIFEGIKGEKKLLILDETTEKIIKCCLTLNDMMEYNTYNIMMISKNRKQNLSYSAVYFVSPTNENCNLIVGDLNDDEEEKKESKYRCAHIFFSTNSNKKMIEKLKTVKDKINSLKDLNFCNFELLDKNVFNFFLSDDYDETIKRYKLEETTSKFKNFLKFVNCDFDINRVETNITKKFVEGLQIIDKQKKNALMLVVDRTYNMTYPFIQSYTYKTLLKYLLGITIQNNKDPVWEKLKNLNFVECFDEHQDLVKKLEAKYPNIVNIEQKKTQVDMTMLGNSANELKMYEEEKKFLSIHFKNIIEIIKTFAHDKNDANPDDKKLVDLYNLQNQLLSTNTVSKEEVLNVLKSPIIPILFKNKFIILYYIMKKLSQKILKELIEISGSKLDAQNIIDNLSKIQNVDLNGEINKVMAKKNIIQSLRRTKIKIIVFILGGITEHEYDIVNKIQKEKDKEFDIILGSTSECTAADFISIANAGKNEDEENIL